VLGPGLLEHPNFRKPSHAQTAPTGSVTMAWSVQDSLNFQFELQ